MNPLGVAIALLIVVAIFRRRDDEHSCPHCGCDQDDFADEEATL